MRIVVGADHGGFPLKAEIVVLLQKVGQEIVDVGAHSLDPMDDYPDFTRAVGRAIQLGKADRGIVVCGSGVGASVAANKMHGIRAGLCHDIYSAHQAVEHDNINVLCLGARVIGVEVAKELVRAFINARFTGEERYARRLAKVDAMES